MKVVDDKLKIIDDVPNSAVEMAVKEKVSVALTTLLLKMNKFFSLVSEESAETRPDSGGGQAGSEAGIQHEENNQGCLQRNTQENRSEGELFTGNVYIRQ